MNKVGMRAMCHYALAMGTRVEAETSNEAATAAARRADDPAAIRSLGEFDVRRVLPAAKRRMVGPFVFLDHMGPAVSRRGTGSPCARIRTSGLATITYLFEGEIMHRDSLGVRQLIPGGSRQPR